MDNVNYYPRMLLSIVEQRLLLNDPFMLFDIGCALGIDPVWRLFGDDLHAHAFDPQLEECTRLEAQENNPNVHYHASFVGLPLSDAFHEVALAAVYLCIFGRGSAEYLKQHRRRYKQAGSSSLGAGASLVPRIEWSNGVHYPFQRGKSQSQSLPPRMESTASTLSRSRSYGHDLEAAASSRDAIRRSNILGFMVECSFAGSGQSNENSFRNVDVFMQQNGFFAVRVRTETVRRAWLYRPRFCILRFIKPYQVNRSGVT